MANINTYDSMWRKKEWSKIPASKRNEWEIHLKDLFRLHRTLTISKIMNLMGMEKWQVYMVLSPLLDEEKVYALKMDRHDRPTKLVYWEDYAEGEAAG